MRTFSFPVGQVSDDTSNAPGPSPVRSLVSLLVHKARHGVISRSPSVCRHLLAGTLVPYTGQRPPRRFRPQERLQEIPGLEPPVRNLSTPYPAGTHVISPSDIPTLDDLPVCAVNSAVAAFLARNRRTLPAAGDRRASPPEDGPAGQRRPIVRRSVPFRNTVVRCAQLMQA